MMGLKSGVFSHIFIDEAGQSTEPETLLPLGIYTNLLFKTFSLIEIYFQHFWIHTEMDKLYWLEILNS